MDDGIGDIISTLKSLDLSDNTIIIFASDNGAPSGQKGGSNHQLKEVNMRFGKVVQELLDSFIFHQVCIIIPIIII